MSYHHGNLKETLIQAGDDELKRSGFELFSLREVSKRAGVSHNAPYRHFKDKDDLIEHIMERTLADLAEQTLSAPLLYPGSALMQIQYVGRLWAHLALRHPQKAHLLLTRVNPTESQNRKHHRGHRLVLASLVSVLEEAQSRFLFSETSSRDLALILLSTFRGLSSLYLFSSTDPKITSEEFGLSDEEDLLNLSDKAVENLLMPHLLE